MWGLRYVDDLVLRDRPGMGERLYAMQDPNWNVTALCSTSGMVDERNGYDTYGNPTVLNSSFSPIGSSAYAWETLFAGYRWDVESGLYQVRNREYQSLLGSWMQRDPLAFKKGEALHCYVDNYPTGLTDPLGLFDRAPQELRSNIVRRILQRGLGAAAAVAVPAIIASARTRFHVLSIYHSSVFRISSDA